MEQQQTILKVVCILSEFLFELKDGQLSFNKERCNVMLGMVSVIIRI